MQDNENNRRIQDLIESENQWSSVKDAKAMLKDVKMNLVISDEAEKLAGIPTHPRNHDAYLKEIIESGTPSK